MFTLRANDSSYNLFYGFFLIIWISCRKLSLRNKNGLRTMRIGKFIEVRHGLKRRREQFTFSANKPRGRRTEASLPFYA